MLKYCFIIVLLFVVACDRQETARKEPQAIPMPVQFQQGNVSWSDPYAYLSDLQSPQSVAYINAETEYFEEITGDWQRDIALLRTELNRDLPVERISPPVRTGRYELGSKIPRGSQYPVFSRTNLDTGLTEMILDTNVRSEGSDYYRLGGFAVNGNLLAITEDRSADGLHDLVVIDLETGKAALYAERVDATLGWIGDRVVAIADRRVMSYVFAEQPQVIYEEFDPAFGISIHKSDDALLIMSESHDSTEIRRLDSDGGIDLVSPRQKGHQYRVKFIDERMIVLSNLMNPDFEIALAEPGDTVQEWQFLELQNGHRVFDFEPVSAGIYLHVKEGLKERISFLSFTDLTVTQLVSGDLGEQLTLHTLGTDDAIRFWRRSPLYPDAYWQTGEEGGPEVVSRETSPDNYDPDLYRLEQFSVTARDNTQVPVTVLYRTGDALADRPLVISAYGAYGLEQELHFDPSRLPLLRRGFILAWAHVRGGGELGSNWHDSGRGLNKRNSFYDYQNVARHLPTMGYGSKEKVVGRFASAGGAIGGFIANDSPGLLEVMTFRSPFVDIVTTLLDETQPLTVSDRLEWGDPRDEDYLRYQLSYSPYHQVSPGSSDQMETDLLVMAGRNDRLVRINEPLKWFAKLRSGNPGDALLLIDIQQNSGHLGATDQLVRRRQTALELAFIFNRLGIRI